MEFAELSDLFTLSRRAQELNLEGEVMDAIAATYPDADLYNAIAAYLLGVPVSEVLPDERQAVKYGRSMALFRSAQNRSYPQESKLRRGCIRL